MTKSQWVLPLALLVFSFGAAFGEDEPGRKTPAKIESARLVTVESLAKELGSKRLRILDSRAAGDYAKGHIPGAVSVDVRQWMAWMSDSKKATDAKHWSKVVSELGIDDQTTVVVYGTSVPTNARLWWALRYLGLKRVGMLDGGWAHWVRAKQRVEKDVADVTPTRVQVRIDKSVLGTTAEVKKCVGNDAFQLLDTRSIGEWERGRIPGATRLEWRELLRADGRFLPREKLEQIFVKQGLDKKKTIVPY